MQYEARLQMPAANAHIHVDYAQKISPNQKSGFKCGIFFTFGNKLDMSTDFYGSHKIFPIHILDLFYILPIYHILQGLCSKL